VSTPASKVEIDVLKRPLIARLFVNYYWLPILLSLSLYLGLYFSNNPNGTWKPSVGVLIELSFYPLFFWAGGFAKSFLLKKIRYTFGELLRVGSFAEQPGGKFPEDFQRRLDSRAADLMGVVAGFLIFIFYLLTGAMESLKHPLTNIAYILIMVIDLMWGYVIGVAIWKVIATACELKQLTVQRRLRIRPFHPDGAAGLIAIGRLYFSLSLILLSIGLFLSGWIVYAHWINREFYETIFHYQWEPWFGGGLVVLLLVTVVAFFWPMLPMHRLMEEQAIDAQGEVEALGERISTSEESLLSQSSQIEPGEIEAQFTKIDSLRRIYSERRRIPTWPADLQMFKKFWTAQIPLIVAFLLSFLTLLEKISGAGKFLKPFIPR